MFWIKLLIAYCLLAAMAKALAAMFVRGFTFDEIEHAKEGCRFVVEVCCDVCNISWENVLLALAMASLCKGYGCDLEVDNLCLDIKDVAPASGYGTWRMTEMKDHPHAQHLYKELRTLEMLLQNLSKATVGPFGYGCGNEVLTDCLLMLNEMKSMKDSVSKSETEHTMRIVEV